mgnify:CR=1 FL=1
MQLRDPACDKLHDCHPPISCTDCGNGSIFCRTLTCPALPLAHFASTASMFILHKPPIAIFLGQTLCMKRAHPYTQRIFYMFVVFGSRV